MAMEDDNKLEKLTSFIMNNSPLGPSVFNELVDGLNPKTSEFSPNPVSLPARKTPVLSPTPTTHLEESKILLSSLGQHQYTPPPSHQTLSVSACYAVSARKAYAEPLRKLNIHEYQLASEAVADPSSSSPMSSSASAKALSRPHASPAPAPKLDTSPSRQSLLATTPKGRLASARAVRNPPSSRPVSSAASPGNEKEHWHDRLSKPKIYPPITREAQKELDVKQAIAMASWLNKHAKS